tara:strand:+ start:12338 stop:12967 length:630 start_codon:yes stop_codon:yes gene_type:complete
MTDKEFPKKIAENVTMYSADPIVYVVSSFLTDEECDAFISASEGKLAKSTVISPGEHIEHKSRISENCWIDHDANDLIHEVSKRLSILVQMPIRNAEQYQLVYYTKQGEYKAHFDSFDYGTPDGKQNWEPGGQRMATALAYLNNVAEGGGTDFPELDVTIEPKKGDVLVFHNCVHGTTNIHPKSLHAGMPVLEGEKWVVNLWFRENLRY